MLKNHMVYFSSVEFFKRQNVYGFSVQVSAFWPLASRFWLLAGSRGPDT
jgi:hypothetical protein